MSFQAHNFSWKTTSFCDLQNTNADGTFLCVYAEAAAFVAFDEAPVLQDHTLPNQKTNTR